MLTGCRKGEILTLRWRDYREGNLYLRDSKTGPRTVWLSSPARAVLEELPRRGRWIFPAKHKRAPMPQIDRFWFGLREAAGLADVRLHDLRHTYASVAMMAGETVLTVGRLLGHTDPETTLKYTHAAAHDIQAAAETVGTALGWGR